MFKRKFVGFGPLVSDEGFALTFGHRSIYHNDGRGKFELPFEDGFLFAKVYQITGEPVCLSPAEVDEVVERVASGIRFVGDAVQIFRVACRRVNKDRLTTLDYGISLVVNTFCED